MVSSELAKPKILALGLPSCGDGSCQWSGGCGDGASRTMTLLLGDNDKLVTYIGLLGLPKQAPKEVKYGKDGIRSELLVYNSRILQNKKNKGISGRGAIVIIKPSKKCNYKNLVDILDEMNIMDIQTFAIVNDFTPEELKLLALN